MVKIDVSLGNCRLQFIKNNIGINRHMPDQGIRDKGDPHTVTGQVVCSDLLVQLQGHTGRKTCIFQEQVRALTCVIACPQQQKRGRCKILYDRRADGTVLIRAVFYGRSIQAEGFRLLSMDKCSRNC